jgi:hypothetical protein
MDPALVKNQGKREEGREEELRKREEWKEGRGRAQVE